MRVWVAALVGATALPASAQGTGPERVMSVIERVERRLRSTRYQHRLRVDERRGEYHGDCSDMVSWVLSEASPRTLRNIGRAGRVSARRIAIAIEEAPIDRPARGLMRIERIEVLRPGDVFAWRTPSDMPAHHTGHTGFVVSTPVRVAENTYTVVVADSIIGRHQHDTRAWDSEGGFGWGTIQLHTDGAGRAVRIGWAGTDSLGSVAVPIVFGRVFP